MAMSNQGDFRTSFPLTRDSDELHEMHCEHCEKLASKYAPAEGFCVECMEYMCGHCMKYHNLYMFAHTVQDKQSMPQDFCFEKCSVHQNQIIKFYCTPCDKIACSECKVNNHKNCSNLSHLPTLVKDIEQSKEFKHLMNDMDDMSKVLEEIAKKIDSNVRCVDLQETNVKSTIKNHKEEIMATFKTYQKETIENFDKKMEEMEKERQEMVDQLADKQMKLNEKLSNADKDVTQKVENSRSVDQTNLKAMKTKNATMTGELKILSPDLVQNQRIGHRCKLFIAMKLAQKDVDKIKQDVSKLKENNDIKHYRVKCETNSMLITLHTRTTFFSYEEMPNPSRRKRSAALHTRMKINEVQYSSLCLLTENKLVVTDLMGCSLLIFTDIQQNNPSFETMEMSSEPWDITKVKDDKVAITLPDQGIIRFMTFSKSLSVTNSEDIKVEGECQGIAYTSDSLIVSYINPAQIQTLDMSGNVLKTFDILDSSKKPVFINPDYLTLSPDNTIIYVSDCITHTVTSLTIGGKVQAVYTDSQLRGPCQLTVDESGAVYVCGLDSHNVHQLSPELTKVKILLDSSQGIECPVSLAYCRSNNRLYVGMYRSSLINVFNLSLE